MNGFLNNAQLKFDHKNSHLRCWNCPTLKNCKKIASRLAALTTTSPPCLLSAKCHVIKWQPLFELAWRHGVKKESSYSQKRNAVLLILIFRWRGNTLLNFISKKKFPYPNLKLNLKSCCGGYFERGMGTKLPYSLASMYIFVLFAIRGHIGKED